MRSLSRNLGSGLGRPAAVRRTARPQPPPAHPADHPAPPPPLPPPSPSPSPPATILWDLDNVRPPAGADPASLLRAVADARAGGPPSLPASSITLFANTATAAALPPGWDPPPPGAALVTLTATPGAVDQAITAAAVAFVTSATATASTFPPPSLTIISSDAAAFASLLRWARARGAHTRAIGTFAGGRPGRPDAWRSRPLPAAADEAVQWGEVVGRLEA